jgi:lysophospholipase L1-like esterase
MVAASLCFVLAVLDLAITVFCLDTSGLGGVQCFTHTNWHQRFARSNQLGYWERDLAPYLEPRQPGRQLVIAVVGDSWTWGQGVHGKERRFTNLLEAELHSHPAGPVTVLNFGRAGADSQEELQLLKDAAKVQPDVVLIGYLANDIDRYASMGSFSVKQSRVWCRVSMLSPTVNLLYWRMVAPPVYAEFGQVYTQAVRHAYADPAIMAKHLGDIDKLVAEVRSMNARPVLAILPFPGMWQTTPGVKDNAVQVRQFRNDVYGTIAQHVRSLGVPVIEAQTIEDEMSAAEFALNPMDNHPSAAAHRRMAQVLAGELSKQGLLQPK